MMLAMLLLLFATFVVPGASQDVNCILADGLQGNVWSVGVEPASGITGKCLPGNPILDVCYVAGVTYTAGPTSTLPGADPSMGGHIARLGTECEPEIVVQFASKCTAIACDASRLVFAIEGVGLRSSNHNGTDEKIIADIAGSYIRNIFLDTATQTCYFVDINTNSVFALDYALNTATATASATATVTAFGTAADGAVAVTTDSEPRRYCAGNIDPEFWDYNQRKCDIERVTFKGSTSARELDEMETAFVALRGSPHPGTLTLGKSTTINEKLSFHFACPAEVLSVSIDYKNNFQIKLDLYDTDGNNIYSMLKEEVRRDNPNKWANSVTWCIDSQVLVSTGVISFGDFLPTNEVKIRNLRFEVCSSFETFCSTDADGNPTSCLNCQDCKGTGEASATIETSATSDVRSLNILYEDCRVERCPVGGPFDACSVVHPSSESQTCLAMSGTTDRVIIYDNENNVIAIGVTGAGCPTVTTITTSIADVVGMHCYIEDGSDPCFPNPCTNGAFCSRDNFSPFQVWCFDIESQIWQMKSLMENP